MNTAYSLVNRHFRKILIAHGWPDDLDLDINLSYCQGDGVAFYGRVHTGCILTLLAALTEHGHLSEAERGILDEAVGDSNLNIVLYRNNSGRCHVHAGTIGMADEDCPDSLDEQLLRRLFTALRADIEDVCGRVKEEGYRIMDAIHPCYVNPVVWQRRTANFVFSVTEVEPADYGGLDRENDILDGLLDAILDQNGTLRTIEVTVTSIHNEQVYAQIRMEDILRLPGQSLYEWFEREWLSDAVREARAEVGVIMKALNSFTRAA